MRLPDHPKPVPGAALYYADRCSVMMKDTTGEYVEIDTRRSPEAAAISARAWQKRENAAVIREKKRQEKLAKTA